MTKRHQQLLVISLSGLLYLNLGPIPHSLADSLTQPSNSPVQGMPGRRLGGGTRHPDRHHSMPLVALVPETNLGITTATYPEFLFYLPTAHDVRDIEFVLWNESEDLIYETIVTVNPGAGIFRIDLAEVEGLAPLELNQNYHWYFSIMADDRAQDLSVDGWTRRVELSPWIQEQTLNPNLTLRLNTASPLEKARLLYQEANLWHDAAVILATLRHTEPHNKAIAQEWRDLLQTVNLTELTTASMESISVVPAGNPEDITSQVD